MTSHEKDRSTAQLTIYPSVWKLALLTCAWLLGATVSIGLASHTLIALIVLPFFIWGVLYGLAKLIVRRPLLVVDDDGLWANPLLGHGQRLRWEEIDSIGLYKRTVARYSYPTLYYVGITPRDGDKWLDRFPSWWQPFVRWYMARVPAPIMIQQSILPISGEQLVRRITTQFARPIREHSVEVLKQQGSF